LKTNQKPYKTIKTSSKFLSSKSSNKTKRYKSFNLKIRTLRNRLTELPLREMIGRLAVEQWFNFRIK